MDKQLFDKLSDQLPERTDIRQWPEFDPAKPFIDQILGKGSGDKSNWLAPTRVLGGGFRRGELSFICGTAMPGLLPKTNFGFELLLEAQRQGKTPIVHKFLQRLGWLEEDHVSLEDSIAKLTAKQMWDGFPDWYVNQQVGHRRGLCDVVDLQFLDRVPATPLTQRIRKAVGLKPRESFSLRVGDHPRTQSDWYHPTDHQSLVMDWIGRQSLGAVSIHDRYLAKYRQSGHVLRSKHEDYYATKLLRNSYSGRTRTYPQIDEVSIPMDVAAKVFAPQAKMRIADLSKLHEHRVHLTDQLGGMGVISEAEKIPPQKHYFTADSLIDSYSSYAMYVQPKEPKPARKDRIPHMKRGGYKGKHK